MMEAPKSYESNGYRYDLIHSSYTNRVSFVNESMESAGNIGLYTMVVPGIAVGYGNHERYFLYYYKRTPIEEKQ